MGMKIEDLLKNELKDHNRFSAGIAHVDIVGSSSLAGSGLEISSTKEALKALLESLFDDLPVAIQSWRGDGGLVLFHDREGLDNLVIICDKLVSLLPFFNQARGILNFLEHDDIHLRVVCHAGFIDNTGNADTLSNDAINHLAKRERLVGITDHVVVTEEVRKKLDRSIVERLSRADEADEKLGNTYVLDRDRSVSTIERNEATSEAMLAWIRRSLEQGRFDEVDIFSYSNETLAQSLPRLAKAQIRILARNWLVEAQEENELIESLRQDQAQLGGRVRMKAKITESNADLLAEYPGLYQGNIEMRFYDGPPTIKGAIMRNSGTDHRAGQFGFYRWEPIREEGGSPFVGRDWSAVWVEDDGGPQSRLLDALESRFDELWKTGHSYEFLKQEEERERREVHWQSQAKKVWEIDGEPYLIIIPARSESERLYPTVATEDLTAMKILESFLTDRGAEVHYEIFDDPYGGEKEERSGHIVFICHRTLGDELLAHMEKEGCPYEFARDPVHGLTLKHRKHNLQFSSPMDFGILLLMCW